jgi:hypothetical protein
LFPPRSHPCFHRSLGSVPLRAPTRAVFRAPSPPQSAAAGDGLSRSPRRVRGRCRGMRARRCCLSRRPPAMGYLGADPQASGSAGPSHPRGSRAAVGRRLGPVAARRRPLARRGPAHTSARRLSESRSSSSPNRRARSSSAAGRAADFACQPRPSRACGSFRFRPRRRVRPAKADASKATASGLIPMARSPGRRLRGRRRPASGPPRCPSVSPHRARSRRGP